MRAEEASTGGKGRSFNAVKRDAVWWYDGADAVTILRLSAGVNDGAGGVVDVGLDGIPSWKRSGKLASTIPNHSK